jgi:hypothetical protein
MTILGQALKREGIGKKDRTKDRNKCYYNDRDVPHRIHQYVLFPQKDPKSKGLASDLTTG